MPWKINQVTFLGYSYSVESAHNISSVKGIVRGASLGLKRAI